MKIAERILLGITALGIVLRIAHIPGGAILSIMMMAILSLFYAGLGYFLFAPPQHEFTLNGMMFRKQKPIDIALSALTGLTYSVGLIALLFRLMHWPGALFLLILAVLSVLIPGVMAVIAFRKENKLFYRTILVRLVLLLALLLVGMIRYF